jgi:hypothetical protein
MAFDPIFVRELLKTIVEEDLGSDVQVEANLTGKEDEFDIFLKRGEKSAPVRIHHDEVIGAMGMGWNTEPIRKKIITASKTI